MKDNNSVAVFTLNGNCYGLDISEIREIILSQPVTELPNTKSYIKGIINFRGDILTLIDVSGIFELDSFKTNYSESKIIILDNKKIGVIVEDVIEIIELNKENQKELDLSGFSNYIDSLFEYNGKVISIVKSDCFLNPESDDYLFVNNNQINILKN